MKLDRKLEVLKAIVEHFVDTAEPVGSNTILVSYNFSVSPATIRNDMMSLEKEGLIYQPHTSAGRIPTDLGYRLFVDNLTNSEDERKNAIKAIEKAQKELSLTKFRDKIYDLVSLLSHITQNASFSTLPDSPRTFYLGLSNVIRQPEFIHDMIRASQVVEVFEQNDNFINTLNNLKIDNSVQTFIGKENLLSQIQSCTIMVTKINLLGHESYLGVLGPTRMNYAFNKAVLEEISKSI